MEELKVYETFNRKDIEEIIKGNIKTVDEKFAQIAPLFVRTGYYLRRQFDEKMYEDAGFDKFEDYVKETYRKSRSWAKRMMQINEKFSVDGNSPLMDEQFVGYSVSHLQEMIYLTDEQLEEVTPNMTVKEIREIRKPAEEEIKEEPVSKLKKPDEMAREYLNTFAKYFIQVKHEWFIQDYTNRVLQVNESPNEIKQMLGNEHRTWYFKINDEVASINMFDDYVQIWNEKHECLGNFDWFYLAAEIQSTWNVVAMEGKEKLVLEESVSILGYPLREYADGREKELQGCGKQYCFRCHRDGCELRQVECYCVEAPIIKPFPCTTINVVDMLREEIGSSCQFVNEDLAYHRAGDGQPVPCCKKCNNNHTCGYACSRAVNKETVLPEEPNVCDVAQESTDQQEVRHFTSDISIDNAYGWTWSEVVSEYFKNGYSNTEKECTISFLGKTYKILKRADVTVFYDEAGNTLFDVTNDRLQEEYGQSHRTQVAVPESTSIDELDLSINTYNILRKAGIDTIEELQGMSDEELAKIRNLGKRSMDEIHKKLEEYFGENEEQLPGQMEIYDYHEVCPEETIIESTGSIIESTECVVEDESEVEIILERQEYNGIFIKDYLEEEEKSLKEYLEIEGLPMVVVMKQEALVKGLRAMLEEVEKDSDEEVVEPEEEPIQPELPVLKNMEQREQFILNYKTWPVWSKNEKTEETYYRYDLLDGSSIVIREYPYNLGWRNEERTGKELFLLKSDTKHFKDGETNMTTLKEHLKEVQKHGR